MQFNSLIKIQRQMDANFPIFLHVYCQRYISIPLQSTYTCFVLGYIYIPNEILNNSRNDPEAVQNTSSTRGADVFRYGD